VPAASSDCVTLKGDQATGKQRIMNGFSSSRPGLASVPWRRAGDEARALSPLTRNHGNVMNTSESLAILPGNHRCGCALCASRFFAPGLRRLPSRLAQAAPARIYKCMRPDGDMYLARPTEELAKFENTLRSSRRRWDVKFVGGDMIPPANADQLAEKVRTPMRAADSSSHMR